MAGPQLGAEDPSSNPARANEFFVGRLQCQNNMKLVFRIPEDGSETKNRQFPKWTFSQHRILVERKIARPQKS